MERVARPILEDVLEGETVGDDLAFPFMIDPIAGAEGVWASGDCRVVEVGFQASGSMTMNDFEGV